MLKFIYQFNYQFSIHNLYIDFHVFKYMYSLFFFLVLKFYEFYIFITQLLNNKKYIILTPTNISVILLFTRIL